MSESIYLIDSSTPKRMKVFDIQVIKYNWDTQIFISVVQEEESNNIKLENSTEINEASLFRIKPTHLSIA